MPKPVIVSATCQPAPDELSLCDPEIRALFEGTQYFIGTPTMAQLVKELRLLREALAKEKP